MEAVQPGQRRSTPEFRDGANCRRRVRCVLRYPNGGRVGSKLDKPRSFGYDRRRRFVSVTSEYRRRGASDGARRDA